MRKPDKHRGSKLLEHLLMVSRRMAEMRSLDNLLIYTIDEVLQLVGAERGYIVLVDQSNSYEFRVRRKLDGTRVMSQADSVSYSILDQVIETGQSMMIADAMTDPRFADAHSVMLMQLRSIMCTPLTISHRVIGAIYV
ncbi:MAG: GAF domain-containing protein, partial [Chloroflexota bacterium]